MSFNIGIKEIFSRERIFFKVNDMGTMENPSEKSDQFQHNPNTHMKFFSQIGTQI